MVLVLSNTKKPLMPCTPKRARLLLNQKKAAVYRVYPFTIILKNRSDGIIQPMELKVDPGSRTTGITLIANRKVVFAANLSHRGYLIVEALRKRGDVRKNRRNRNTRYRAAKFDNKKKGKGWLPPSILSRVYNIATWTKRLAKFSPISKCAMESAKFDTQKMENNSISGIEYQQGALYNCTVREYLLEKWGHKCAYCDRNDVKLETEHIICKARGGTNRASNLILSCKPCNEKKSIQNLESFLKNKPNKLKQVSSLIKESLKDAAAMNSMRYAVGEVVKNLGCPTTFWSGSRTSTNRRLQGHPKDHWVDAACVGISGENVELGKIKCLTIRAMGHGNRQVCHTNKFGFPDAKPALVKKYKGFRTGDIAIATVTAGKKVGVYKGRIKIRSSGRFGILTSLGKVDGLSYKLFRKTHMADGYAYAYPKHEKVKQ